jgi:hypothetical protein
MGIRRLEHLLLRHRVLCTKDMFLHVRRHCHRHLPKRSEKRVSALPLPPLLKDRPILSSSGSPIRPNCELLTRPLVLQRPFYPSKYRAAGAARTWLAVPAKPDYGDDERGDIDDDVENFHDPALPSIGVTQ